MDDHREIDQARVRQVVLAIPTSIDVGDFAGAERLFADPVRVDYTSLWGGIAESMSPSEVVEGWRALVPGFDATWHELGAIECVLDGTRAAARCAVDARHWLGTAIWRLRGWYEFELERSDRWRVTLMRFSLGKELGDRGLVDQARQRVARRGGTAAVSLE